jgi:hypothetical protein
VEFYDASTRRILSTPVSSFLSASPWSERSDFLPISPRALDRLVRASRSILSKSPSTDGLNVPTLSRDNAVSLLLLYSGDTPVTVATFSVGSHTTRSFVDLHNLRTVAPHRGRGHASLALALVKEIACCNPLKEAAAGQL